MKNDQKYDLVLVGTGFASSFFLLRYLAHAGPKARVLVLERGIMRTHDWRIEHRRELENEFYKTCENVNPNKPWTTPLGFGGGSNCWWACTPRMLPEDFEMKSRFGVGVDWPVAYDDLEEYYCDAEEVMAVSGPSDGSPFPRSRPYVQPPHYFNDVDRLFKKAFPDQFYPQPSARPTRDLDNRPACCATGTCELCPIDSKFTVINELLHLYEDERVTLVYGASVQSLDTGEE